MDDTSRFDTIRRALRQPERSLYFAPIRHHSPACAWAVRELIREVEPHHILIEAPIDLSQHIELLLHEETKPPVAIAAIVQQDKKSRLAAYYPFCVHSPEFVALETGRAIGADLSFIDLPVADKAMFAVVRQDTRVIVDDERYFDSGDYVDALCRKLGCRDGYELWDHLFESRLGSADWQGLLADIGAYCAALRAATSEETIRNSGDTAREAHMAVAVNNALTAGGAVVVIAGGFHIPALANSIALDKKNMTKVTDAVSGSYLIRYSFAALDALSGYAAGLPQPGYYDYLWHRANAMAGAPQWRETALDLVSRFSAKVRKEGHAISVPAQVEMLRVAEDLAMMRGRNGIGRHNLIDAARTTLVKGEVGAREIWTEHLLEFLRGNAIGDVPASAGLPPLIEDVRVRARSHRIDVTDGTRRRRRLDIRRKPAHLAASRYFHAMTLLDSGFAERESGPDYLSGVNTERLFEEWSYAWSPMVEGRLIELAMHGDNLPDACVHLLEMRREEMQAGGRSRDIAGMANLFVQGVLAGLGPKLIIFLHELAADIQAHGEFDLVAETLRRIHNIARSTGPLGIPKALELGSVCESAYRRLVYLCDDLPNTPQERVQSRMQALRLIVELLQDPTVEVFDHSLFDEAIDRVADASPPPEILGSVLAICVQAKRRDAEEICSAISGSFTGTVNRQEERIGVLHGLLFTVPELLWRSDRILKVVDQLLCSLTEDDFLALLPHIRLAFTTLNPRECDRLAGMLVHVHGGHVTAFMGRSHELTDRDLHRGVQLERTIRETIKADRLERWLETPS